MTTDQQKQFVLLIALRDTDILAIEIVAIEVAASSHTLFCCRIRRASEHSGGLFKQSSLVYLLQTHPHTNKQLTLPSFFYGMKKAVVLFYYRNIDKKYICNAVVPSLNQDSGEVHGQSLNLLEFICVSNTPFFFRNVNSAFC